MKKIFRLVAPLVLMMPLFAAAQTGVNVSYLQNYSNSITGVINYILVPVLMAIAFIVFLWGVYKYFIFGAADEKSRTDGRQFTLWGVIGFVVILSLWGIVNIFMSTLGLSVGTAPPYPTIGNVGGVQSTTGGSVFGDGQTVGGSYGTAAQNATLTQQNTQKDATCSQYGSASPECQAAQAAYSASYFSVYPNSSATTQNAQISTVGAGADCTYNPCAAGLTCGMSLGYPTCEAAGSGTGTDTSGTDQYYNYTDTNTYGDNGFTP
ncbi:MAG: pilin [Candidatus Parcubacteria bacterium]|nr:pilin [Candidatus Parcubacteria bacterium]